MQINELRISSPGGRDDVSNFVELFAAPGTRTDGLALLVLSGEFAPGQVDFAFDLSGGAADGEGVFLLAAEGTDTPLDPGDLTAAFDFFGSPSSFLLVEGFTGAAGEDLDADDDGTLDATPWTALLDGVSLIDGDGTPDLSYAEAVVGPDGAFAPAGLAARPDGSGAFELLAFADESEDSPGRSNAPGPLPVPGAFSPAEVIPAPGAPAPLDSAAGGSVAARGLPGPADGLAIRFSIALEGVDLVEDPALRTDPDDVTALDFRLGGIGETGEILFDLLAAAEAGAVEIDYEAETLTGIWDSQAVPGGFGANPNLFAEAILGLGVYAEVATVAFDRPETAELRAQIDTVAPAPMVPIPAIQGAGHVSPFVAESFAAWIAAEGELEGARVATTGVVTAVDGNGFYLQDPAGDGDPATSDALFVATEGAPEPIAGQAVAVVGRVAETVPGGVATRNLPTTEIAAEYVEIFDAAPTVFPTATVLGAAGRLPPSETIDDDAFAAFEPETDGIDFFESLEGMLVSLPQGVAVAGTNRFGELFVVADEAAASGLSARGTLNISPDDFNPEKIQIDADPDITPDFAVPEVDTLIGVAGVEGVVSYDFGNFQIVPTAPFAVTEGPLLGRETSPLRGDLDTMTVATYNLLNLDPNDEDGDADIADGRFDAIARDIVEALGAPDILALQEVQDNSGSVDDGTVAADLTLATLVAAIEAAGGPSYEFIDNDLISDNASGGQPGGNIRTAFLYNPARVEARSEGNLPDFAGLQDEGAPFEGARLPIAGGFRFWGEVPELSTDPPIDPARDVLIVNAHFSSKGGSAPILGTEQPFAARQEEPGVNGSLDERQAQAGAAALQGLIDAYTRADAPTAGLGAIVLGDFNEFEFVSPVAEILPGDDGTGAPRLVNTTEYLPEDERYSFVFQGNSQSLDHILIDADIAAGAEVDIVHLNAEFAARPGRASDHDPILLAVPYGAGVARIVGTGGDDALAGTAASEAIGGFAGDDRIAGSPGDDTLSGSLGTDTAVYAAPRDALGIALGADGAVTVTAADGTDRLLQIERIEVADGALLYDLLDAPELGFVYRSYAAAYGRAPDEAGLRFNLAAVEAGLAPDALAEAFVETPEFALLYGADPAAERYVDALYENALGREADGPGRAFWVSALEAGGLDRAGLLSVFAESPENVARTEPDLADGAFVGLFDMG